MKLQWERMSENRCYQNRNHVWSVNIQCPQGEYNREKALEKLQKERKNTSPESAVHKGIGSQLSLAIGKEGQNARLAAKLTGYKIDIKSESQAAELSEELDFGGDFDEMEDFDLEAPAEETEEVSELTEAGESSSEEEESFEEEIPEEPEQ